MASILDLTDTLKQCYISLALSFAMEIYIPGDKIWALETDRLVTLNTTGVSTQNYII